MAGQGRRNRKVTIKNIMTSQAFRLGMQDYMTGSWHESWELPEVKGNYLKDTFYERGRQFANYMLNVKKQFIEIGAGKNFNVEAAKIYLAARESGDII